MASLYPSHGARVVLERESMDGAAARYRASIYEPSAVHECAVELDASGARFAEWSTEPPRWALVFTERLVKGLPKKHAADASWPRKIVRWRDERE